MHSLPALIWKSYGWGASGKVTIPVTVTTKEGEEKKECVALCWLEADDVGTLRCVGNATCRS